MTTLTPTQLLAEIEDAIRSAPKHHTASDAIAWVGRVTSLLKRWAPDRSMIIDSHARGSVGIAPNMAASEFSAVLILLHEARHDLRLNEVGPLSSALDRGSVLDYFEEIRRVIVAAKSDLFFVDPYLDAEFVTRYLPHVPPGTAVRLLGRKGLPALAPAVDLAASQFSLTIALRASPSLHDRFIFVDRTRGFHSGASFKDGARLAPTIFTEVTDALPSVQATYEQMWSAATVHR